MACQRANARHWHGRASEFPKGATHASVSALLIPLGERKGTTPLDSVEDKEKSLEKICAEKKWCAPAPKGAGMDEGTAEITQPPTMTTTSK